MINSSRYIEQLRSPASNERDAGVKHDHLGPDGFLQANAKEEFAVGIAPTPHFNAVSGKETFDVVPTPGTIQWNKEVGAVDAQEAAPTGDEESPDASTPPLLPIRVPQALRRYLRQQRPVKICQKNQYLFHRTPSSHNIENLFYYNTLHRNVKQAKSPKNGFILGHIAECAQPARENARP